MPRGCCPDAVAISLLVFNSFFMWSLCSWWHPAAVCLPAEQDGEAARVVQSSVRVKLQGNLRHGALLWFNKQYAAILTCKALSYTDTHMGSWSTISLGRSREREWGAVWRQERVVRGTRGTRWETHGKMINDMRMYSGNIIFCPARHNVQSATWSEHARCWRDKSWRVPCAPTLFWLFGSSFHPPIHFLAVFTRRWGYNLDHFAVYRRDKQPFTLALVLKSSGLEIKPTTSSWYFARWRR